MTIRAQLANGTILEFPDGTPDAVIDRTVRHQMTGSATAVKPQNRDTYDKIMLTRPPTSMAEARARDQADRDIADAAKNEGYFDRVGSLLRRWDNTFRQGAATVRSVIQQANADHPLPWTSNENIRSARRDANEARGQARQLGRAANADVAGEQTVGDFFDHPSIGKVPGLINDLAVQSVPGMAASIAAFPLAAASLSGNIAQQRAQNQGHEDATAGDLGLAAPAGITSALLDRFGAENIIGAEGKNAAVRIGKATLGEAATEAAQNTIEYAGSNAGTIAGFDWRTAGRGALESAFGGGLLGGTMRGVQEGGGAIYSRLRRPVAPGVRETAAESAPITQADEASPIPTDLIASGKSDIAQAEATPVANAILQDAGMPAVGRRVVVSMPDGSSMTGTVNDAFDTDAGALGRAKGIKIAMDDGTTFNEHFDTIHDAGVSITEQGPTAEADQIDAALRDAASRVVQVVDSETPTPARTAGGHRTAPAQPKDRKDVAQRMVDITLSTESGGRRYGKDGKLLTSTKGAAGEMQVMPGTNRDPGFGVRPARDNSAEELARVGRDYLQTMMQRYGNDPAKAWAAYNAGPGRVDAAIKAHGASWLDAMPPETKAYVAKNMAALGGSAAPSVSEASAPTEADTLPMHRQRGAESSTTAEEIASSSLAQDNREAVTGPLGQPETVSGKGASEDRNSDIAGQPIDKDWTAFNPASGTLEIPRSDMPQIKAEHRGAMVRFLNARGIAHQEVTIPAADLKPTQAEFSPAKVEKAAGYNGGDRAILVSSDGYVLDGHHQWMGKRAAGEDVRAIRLDAPISRLLKVVPEFPSATSADGALGSAPASSSSPETMPESSTKNADKSAIPTVHDSASSTTPIITDMPSGKSVIVKGASNEQLAAIKAALPAKVLPIENKKLGGIVYSKKHEAKIRSALAMNGAQETAADTTAGKHPGLIIHNLRTGKETIVNPQEKVPAPPLPVEDDRRLTKVREAKEMGIRARKDGDKRVPPSVLQGDNGLEGAWLEGYGSQTAQEVRSPDASPASADKKSPTPSPVKDAESQPDQAGSYGSQNKVFTADAAEKARALLRSKLNQLNSGFDPEVAQAGLTLMGYHIEAGARVFMDAARAVAKDLGLNPVDLRNSLRSWYSSARMWMEDNGHDVRGMDDDAAVRVDLSRIDQWGTADSTESSGKGISNADELQGNLSSGDAGEGPADVQRTAAKRGDGQPSDAQDAGSLRALPDADRGGQKAAERGSGRHSGPEDRRGASSRDTDRLPVRGSTGTNWRIEPGSLKEGRSPSQKARENIAAIDIVKRLDRDGLPATAAEQAEIARYVGWGGLKNAFPDADGNFGKGFEEIGPRLRALLSDEEYDTARRSIQYAHYTPENVVRSMWSAAQRLGFKGGTIFEPGMGTGNFAGMMPAGVAAASRYQGIEYDRLTARIAHHLYPQSGVRQGDYTRAPRALDAYDLVIGNPPFSETVVSADPDYAGKGFLLHDYFFAKSLDQVRPGGLLMFVTSAGTMNKASTKARDYLADRADLVGAIRLPGNTFEKNAGTAVTTDIVILRKRLPGEHAGDRGWTETVERTLPTRNGGTKTGPVSRYFSEHPEMILGEEGYFDKLVAGERYAVRAPDGYDLATGLRKAIARLPIDILSSRSEASSEAIDLNASEHKEGSFYIGDKGRLMQMKDGKGMAVQTRGKGVKGGIPAAGQERILGLIPIRDALRTVYAHDLAGHTAEADKARAELNRHYDAFVAKFGPVNKAEFSYRRPTIIQQESARMQMREDERMAGRSWDEGSFDATDMIEHGESASAVARAREEARQLAIESGSSWSEGSFNPGDLPDIVLTKRPNLDPFMDDEESYRLAAIEHYDEETGTASKGRVFSENAIRLEAKPQIASTQDALLHVMNTHGRPDIAEIMRLSGLSEQEVLTDLGDGIFAVPGHDGAYQTKAQYLSGNVRAKLLQAREEAKRDDRFERNVRALEAVQPAPLGPADIAANLGMPWIPTDLFSDFGKHLGLSALKVSYFPKLAQWSVSGDATSAAATTTWGTSDRAATDILSDALNRQQPKIYRKVDTADGVKSVLDATATQAAQDKVAEIKQAFRDWIWADEARTSRLTTLYNENYNNLVAPSYDGSYLTTPGISSAWSWRPHQTSVISRIIQTGNTYMAHEVGAGKTSAMIGAGMEMKRLGLVNKPMYVVPNHMLGQFTKEFYEQYPLARIAVADERRFHTSRRKQFIANVAANDLDAVIITHSAFGFIPLSDDFTDGLIRQELDDYRSLLEEVPKGDQEARFTRRRIEQRIEQLEQRLSGKGNRARDHVFTFEEMGADFLFVDEAHLFRKLDFATKMGNVKGIDPTGSKMSFDLFAKVSYLETRRPGRSVVLASGTPITNTMAELFSVSRYLQMPELEARGLSQFDAWAGAFGDTHTALEQDPAGGYKSVTRFAKFVNVPELSVMVRQVMDVVTGADLEKYVVRPKLKGGKRNMVVVDQTDGQSAYQDVLKTRMEAIQQRSGPPKPGDDILLSVIGDGRKNAIDYRLIDPSAEKAPSKLETMIANTARIWKETKRQPFHAITKDGYSADPVDFGPATQMIFSDLGINGDFPVHKYIAGSLQRRGVPKGEIAIISDYKTHVAKQRLFNDMNEGKVRILIGSVAKMGTGVNAQRRLYAVHNMDPQWYPANDQQRNGRIVRQGNMNPEVEINDYSTKGTYDSQMWQLMETKARFIEGFMRGDPTMRDMEDLGEASQYEQAKAMTTTDPRIAELTEWKQDLEKAMRRRSAFDREVQAVRSRIAQSESSRAEAEQHIPHIKADIAARTDSYRGENFTGNVGDKTFDKREDFGEALLAQADEMAGHPKVVYEPMRAIGSMGGFRIAVDFVNGVDGIPSPRFFVLRNGGYETRIKEGESTGARGLVARIANALDNFEQELANAQDTVERMRSKIKDFQPQLERTFGGTDEIRTLRSKIDQMEATLEKEGASAQQGNAPKASIPDLGEPVVVLSGEDLGEHVDILDLGRKARAWFKSHLRLKTVTSSDGVPVSFGRVGESKINGGERIFRAVPAIAAIIEKGVHTGPFAPSEKWASKGAVAMHHYTANVTVGTDTRAYGVLVHEMQNGRRFYYLTDNPGGNAGSRSSLTEGRPEEAVARVEVTPGADLNIFEVGTGGNDGPGIDQIWSDALAQMERLGIADRVVLSVRETISDNRRMAGLYRSGIIEIALSSPQDPSFTISHEAVHALRDMGLFLPAEWASLEKAARADTAMMDSVRRRYPGLGEDALTEEAIADRYAQWVQGKKEKGFAAKAFERVRTFFKALASALQGNGFTSAEAVMRAIDNGEMGARNSQALLDGSDMNARASIPDTPAFDDAETERRFQAAKDGIASTATLKERVTEWLETGWNGFSRHWMNLPNIPRYSALQQKLRAIESAPQQAKERTVRMLEDMVKDFTKDDLDLFTRKVILDDLMWDAGNDRDLPFGLTPQTVAREKAKIDALVEAQPDKKVWKAAMKRKLANRTIANELVAAGVLEAEQIKNPAYYRHQVLEYARAEQQRAHSVRGVGNRLRSPRWAKRMGSSLDINANLLEAEFDWLNKAFTDIPVAKTIEWIKQSEHNILPDLQKQAKDSNAARLQEKLDEAQETLNDDRASEDERREAASILDAFRGFRQHIAMGFDTVRQAIMSNQVDNVPARFETAMENIAVGRSNTNEPPFPFLSWLLDENKAGAPGAAMIYKAISQRRVLTEKLIGRDYVDPTDAEALIKHLAPEGYRTWQPDEGKLLFTAKTLPEHALDRMMQMLDAPEGIDPAEFRAQLEKGRAALMVGGDRYTMVLPEEVADTLNQLRRVDLEGLYDFLVQAPLRAWKRWVLINPRRFIKYNLNNITGDLDAVIAGNPRTLRHVYRAAKELAAVMSGRANPSERYTEAVERGVFDSGVSIQEIPDLHAFAPFERFAKDGRSPTKLAMLPLRKAWNALQGSTQWRENIIRYAAYIDYVERLERGEAQSSVGYGASIPAMVDAVPDIHDRAALLARDLAGDYGAISHFGGGLRKSVIPFWSWMEINTRRYWRLTVNAGKLGVGHGLAVGGGLAISKGIGLTAYLAIRAAMIYGLIQMWNTLFFPDEEKDLGEQQQAQLHIILGRDSDGQVVTLRTQGAMSDALSWFGIGDTVKAFREYEKGRASLSEALMTPFKAPVNKIGTALSPAITLPFETASGKKFWPDLFNMRENRDPWRNILSSFSLDNEYDWLMEKPSRGYARSWVDAITYRRDPGEIAYNEARGIAYDWLRNVKGQSGSSSFSTPRSEALRDYRTALRYGDEPAADRAIDRMIDLGVDDKDLSASIKRADPLGPIAKQDRAAFLDQLTDEELETFEKADQWYRQTFLQ